MRTIGRLSAISALFLALTGASAAPAPPPGHNVHIIQETPTGVFWRGGAPRKDTLAALAAAARKRGAQVTLIDLRKPANSDDRSGKGGRLSPADEAAQARQLGIRYVAISALDRQLNARLKEALSRGDVYMHCMYGVNRTGFATARYARAAGISVGREGLGKRDWTQGEKFQRQVR